MNTVQQVQFGEFTFKLKSRTLELAPGKPLSIRPEHAAILSDLATKMGEVVSKEALYRSLCKRGQGKKPPAPKIIDVQICTLRNILDSFSKNGGDHVVTVWGKGYSLSEKPQPRKKAITCERGVRNKGLQDRLASLQANV